MRLLLSVRAGRGDGVSDVISGKCWQGVYIVLASGGQNISPRFDLPTQGLHRDDKGGPSSLGGVEVDGWSTQLVCRSFLGLAVDHMA
jgi:hypothetical protein